jgi:hypothetical protein
MSLDDVEYYRLRARQERGLAEAATSPEAAKAHEELAKNYEALIERSDMLPRTRGVVANEDEADRAA